MFIEGVDEDDYQRINIRRGYILKDTFRQLSKASFTTKQMLRVVFCNEQAVDAGGSRREYFSLVFRELFKQSGLFTGYAGNVIPLHDVIAIESTMLGSR